MMEKGCPVTIITVQYHQQKEIYHIEGKHLKVFVIANYLKQDVTIANLH